MNCITSNSIAMNPIDTKSNESKAKYSLKPIENGYGVKCGNWFVVFSEPFEIEKEELNTMIIPRTRLSCVGGLKSVKFLTEAYENNLLIHKVPLVSESFSIDTRSISFKAALALLRNKLQI